MLARTPEGDHHEAEELANRISGFFGLDGLVSSVVLGIFIRI